MANKTTELKAKTKALKAKVRALRARLAEVMSQTMAPVGKKKTVSPLAPVNGFPQLPIIDGVEFAVAAAGVRYANRADVMLARLVPGTVIAGTFTRSATRAASVLDCQAKLPSDSSAGAAILVNSGNANAFTGSLGVATVNALSSAVSDTLGIPAARVFTSSTGVIGETLPHEKIVAALQTLTTGLAADQIAQAANAIMTTDTFPKGASAEIIIDGETIKIAGIAKGSGMIAPDMATMLVYIFTDAKISQVNLQRMVSRQTDASFNNITVDSDTSTSDALIIAATGQSAAPAITDMRSIAARSFERALGLVMLDLAKQVVRDGEGATKFVEVQVTGAVDAQDARKVAMSIANSPLVKTAVAGEDANWGRIVMAVGKSGAQADRDLLSIRFGDTRVAESGAVVAGYDEAVVSAYMKQPELVIGVDLGLGAGALTVWTCDLTHGYIDINADYRS
jgi:glutamate N-acetyltransferase/amino-acid N-acetyltransferase